jgi:hypothetical protein
LNPSYIHTYTPSLSLTLTHSLTHTHTRIDTLVSVCRVHRECCFRLSVSRGDGVRVHEPARAPPSLPSVLRGDGVHGGCVCVDVCGCVRVRV